MNTCDWHSSGISSSESSVLKSRDDKDGRRGISGDRGKVCLFAITNSSRHHMPR